MGNKIKRVDILLINPPIPYVTNKNLLLERNTQINFGLCCLAAILKKVGYNAGIIDAFPTDLKERDILKRVEEIKPKIIGLSVLTISLRELYSLVKKLKEFNDIEIILGGFHLTMQPEILKVVNLKYALFGEADYSFVDLCNYIIKGEGKLEDINGLIYNDNGNLKFNKYEELKDLDSLPLPSYDSFLHKFDKSVMYLATSRGCKFRCKFCSDFIMRKKVILRSPKKVIEDIKFIISHYSPGTLMFIDETFTTDREYVLRICELIKEENLKFNWRCLTRVDCLDEELLTVMKNSGLNSLFLGIEVGNEKLRYSLGKKFSNNDCIRIIKLSKKLGIHTTSFFMIGLPEETEDDIKKTVNFCKELNTDDMFINIYIMLPGSPIYNQLLKEGYVKNEDWINYMLGKGNFPFLAHKYIESNKLQKIETRTRREFYINIKIFKKRLNLQKLKLIFYILQESIYLEIIKPFLDIIKIFKLSK